MTQKIPAKEQIDDDKKMDHFQNGQIRVCMQQAPHLCWNENGLQYGNHLSADFVFRSMQQHDIGNAEQWYQHQQRFGRRFILTCFGRIC